MVIALTRTPRGCDVNFAVDTTRLSEDQAQAFAAEPGNGEVGFCESSGDEQRVMRPFLKADLDLARGEIDVRHGVDEIAEDVP